jgi:RNA polymerase sigma factor (sigma-70 family)
MSDANDMDLVREFARDNSEAAFTELVRRHLNLVYSVARRCIGNDGDAQDVAQAVFIILARKAAGLREKTLLTGWFYETTRFTAARLLRTNGRRHAREQEAYMQSTLNEADQSEVWEKLAPHLEAAMDKLSQRDRALLVLRFYENKSGPEAAALLGIREDAAHKRVTRAIEKLRKFFVKRGVTLTATAIAGAVSANSVQAAPVALAKTISAVAVAKGAAATTSTLTLVKGALKIMAWTKMKTVVVIVASGLVLATSVSVVVIEKPRLIQGKTESEWINSIVYFGDDNQMNRWHSLGPKGIQMLVRALKPPPDGLTEEQAYTNRVNRMKAASVLSQLENNKLGNDANRAIPEIINDIKTENDGGVLGIELVFFEMPIQTMDEKKKAVLFPELLRAMQRNDSAVRYNALVALQYYPNQADMVIPLMITALQDPISGVRLMAIKALSKVDPQNAAGSNFVAIAAGCVTGSPGDMPGAVNDAVIMLGQLHREPGIAVPALVQGLQSPESYVRKNSAAALGRFGGQARPAVSALQIALEDSDTNVRRQAAAALKRINSGAAAN